MGGKGKSSEGYKREKLLHGQAPSDAEQHINMIRRGPPQHSDHDTVTAKVDTFALHATRMHRGDGLALYDPLEREHT
jgi:hypothetical protein